MKTFLFLIVIITVVSCKKDNEKTKPVIENISESVYASGIVKSKNQYQVYSTVNGLIQDILVHDGDTVIKGEPLIRVQNESSNLNVYNAKLAADNALYSNADKLREAKVAINLAKSNMKNDSLLLMRQRNLWAQKIGSLIDYEQKQLAFKNSYANYETARLNYLELKRQLEFVSDQSKTNLQLSNVLASDYLIKADATGKVYKILKVKGEFVNTLNPVAIIGDVSEFLIELKVDEYDIARIQIGQKILITLDSYKGKVFDAVVAEIEPLMNEQSRSFTVNAVFVSKPEVLYPNLSVEANIVIHSKEKAMTIPRAYLTNDSTVLLKKDVKRKVVVGLKDYQKVEILSGLTVNDMIYKPKP